MARINKSFIALALFSITSIQLVLSRNIENKNEFPNLGIVNGKKSVIMKPWICTIWKENQLVCGCSILNSTKILTAAHCLQNHWLLPMDLKVGVGELHKDLQTKYPVKSFMNHPSYSDVVEFANDVAIITLEVPIIFIDGFVSPITLFEDCDKGNIPANTSAFIQGWGKRDPESNVGSDELYEAEIIILSRDDEGCTYYEKKGWLTESMMCAGHPHGVIDSCAGDSGGPLVNELNEQIGIVSWGEGCAAAKSPGVYTYICAVKDFILNPIGVEHNNDKEDWDDLDYSWIFDT